MKAEVVDRTRVMLSAEDTDERMILDTWFRKDPRIESSQKFFDSQIKAIVVEFTVDR